MNRRQFIKSLGIVSFSAGFSAPLLASESRAMSGRRRKYLILLELKGGNDSLNTVVPLRDPLYQKQRPTLAISKDKALALDEKTGLHPSLKTLRALFEQGSVAIVQGVGYEPPNFSHFSSIDIWESASHTRAAKDGWLYQVFANNPSSSGIVDAIVFAGSSGFFRGEKPSFLVMKSVDDFIQDSKKLSFDKKPSQTSNPVIAHLRRGKQTVLRTSKVLEQTTDFVGSIADDFPDTDIGNQFADAARLINTGFHTPVIKLSMRGFDTHVRQQQAHARLLAELDDALHAFNLALVKRNLWQDVLLMSYSEFGRRVKENGSSGTDHGAAGCNFIIGSGCRGGLYGEAPQLARLHKGNVVHKVDFRQLYSTLENRWFGIKNNVVDKRIYSELDFL